MLCHVLFDLSHDLFAEILFGLGLGRYHAEDTPDLGRILWSSQNFFSTPVRMCLEIIEVDRAEPRVEETIRVSYLLERFTSCKPTRLKYDSRRGQVVLVDEAGGVNRVAANRDDCVVMSGIGYP
jgi:hypothetical protein